MNDRFAWIVSKSVRQHNSSDGAKEQESRYCLFSGNSAHTVEKAERQEARAQKKAERQEQKKENAATEGSEERYHISERFQRDIQDWYNAGQPEGERFVLGSTGPVLQGLGAIESDIYMNGDKISSILEKHPEMSIREIKRIPEILEDPVLILKRKGTGKRGNNSRMVLYGSIKAQNGKPVLVSLDLRPVERGFAINDMQKVNSAYAKDIYLRSDKINRILEQHPEMSLREIQRIPEILEDPTLILKSKGENVGG
ncbi:MAG: hypothetical protein MR033_06860, partial [Clostridiales bacterium]|nr:hypothetical protein [Clostridiales bacterium]